MIVTFAVQPDLDTLRKYSPNLTVENQLQVKITLDKADRLHSQQSILEGLGKMQQEITSISSKSFSLDDIFQEVCL